MRYNKKYTTESRKSEHISITLNKNVNFKSKSAGFEKYDFYHNALPELNKDEINTEVFFLNKKLNFPFMVSGMTGGYADASKINATLAEFCEMKKIAMGVGSQRQALENSHYIDTFRIVRKKAANIPIVGNIGAVELTQMRSKAPVLKLVEMINADALAVHLNPLQELLQPEGNTNFRNVLKSIEKLVNELDIPVIVKEVGAGISFDVARRLYEAGVRIIDAAGAGGTSWAGIEMIRSNDFKLSEIFWDWGIPTTESILNIRKVSKKIFIIASGGIRNGVEIAKSIALGADLTAAAAPLLRKWKDGCLKSLINLFDLWETQLKGVMFLVGAKNIKQLKKIKLKTV